TCRRRGAIAARSARDFGVGRHTTLGEARSARCRPLDDSKEMPLALDAFQAVDAALFKLDTRTGHDILDRARYQDLARAGQRRDAGSGMHGDALDTLADQLTLAHVNARSYLDTQSPDGARDGAGAAYCARGTI